MEIIRSLIGRTLHLLARDPVRTARAIGVTVGEQCRILTNPYRCFGSEPYLVELGDHVTITGGVQFITHDGGVWVFREELPDIDVFGPIVVGDNVFIGFGSIILPNVRIGNDCVIGAGAVVTRDIPPNSVAVGVPARVIKTLEAYRTECLQQATYIRSLPYKEKRRQLILRYGMRT